MRETIPMISPKRGAGVNLCANAMVELENSCDFLNLYSVSLSSENQKREN